MSKTYNLPFSDLKVVELATVLAGPSVGMFFAELGATVIKIENPHTRGDVTRGWKTAAEHPDKVSAYFASVNWGKHHLFADLKTAEGQTLLHTHLSDADILLTNFKYGDAEKYGLHYSALRDKYPKLICGEITGFASQPERVAYDFAVQAETGFMHLNGEAGRGGIKMPVAMMDVLAAHQLKEGLLTALWVRQKTGKGCRVSASLEESGLASLANQASNFLMTGEEPQPIGSLHPNIAPYGEQFLCKDKKTIVLAVGADAQFAKLCRILGHSALAAVETYATNAARVKNRNDLAEALAPLFLAKERAEWLEILHTEKIPCAALKTVAEALSTPLAKAMTLTETTENTETKRLKSVVFKMED